MSDRWGFDLSMEAVRLMRREGGHWREVAREKIDGADIEDRLKALAARVDPPVPVDVFLPRDQILYTDVEITDDATAVAEIDRAMDGRTPYTLDELELDWAITAPGTARVAAIARETLDEAHAFAEARGLSVRGFSSLAGPEDFPRLPDFGGGFDDDDTGEDDVEGPEDAPAPGFSSVRKAAPATKPIPDASPPLVLTAAADTGPVVHVADATPVLSVADPALPPLDPGPPLPRETSQPRVFTNLDAERAGKRAASLRAAPSITVRPKDRALPTPALAAVAAALSVGIALVIWSILPNAPEPETGALEPATEEAVETARLDAPAPAVGPAIPGISAPSAEEAAVAAPAPLSARPATGTVSGLGLEPEAEPDTTLAAIAALDPRPEALRGVDAFMPEPPVLDGGALAAVPAGVSPIERPDIVARHDAPLVGLDPEADAPPITEGPPPPEVAALDAAIADEPDAELLTEAAPEAANETEAAAVETDTAAVDETPSEPAEALTGAAALVPTDLARALPDRAPRARPGDFVVEIERQQFGGRSRAELARIRPGARPNSAQIAALVELASRAATDLAISASPPPPDKPQDFDALVATAQLRLREEREAAQLAALTPDTSAAIEAALAEELEPEEEATRAQNSPRLAIPSDASVAQRATFEDAIRLNQINLVGVFGLPSDRRALIRLPSGRFVKVKVGDKIDGGTIAAITDSKLQYRKGNRTLELTIPQG